MGAPKGNKFARGNKGGRPVKYTADEFSLKVQEYFKDCVKNKKIATKGGLAIYFDVTRETLRDYGEKSQDFSDTIKKAYQLIEENWVQNLSGNAVAGTIFYLKNAFSKDWRDKQEVENTGTLTLTQKLLNAQQKRDN